MPAGHRPALAAEHLVQPARSARSTRPTGCAPWRAARTASSCWSGPGATSQIFLERRKREPGIVAGLLSLEGAHALEGDPANVDRLFDAGFRMMSLAHFFDNEMAGSAHGVDKGGLTDKGRELVRRMEAKG